MVKVREDHPINDDGSVNVDSWLQRLDSIATPEETEVLKYACNVSKQADNKLPTPEYTWTKNTSSFHTGLEMAEILAELKMDPESLIAAVLYRPVREHKLELAEVEEKFGAAVAKLIEGVLRMAAISQLELNPGKVVLGQNVDQLENIRKMLVAMVDDVRIALIKLAERTCAIRVLKDATPERQERVAKEVFQVYAPLAQRLGIGHIKWELEDLAFRYLRADAYKKIAKLLAEKRVSRDEYISNVIEELEGKLKASGVDAEFSGRSKHIYSIWKKMQRKGIEFSEVYDVRAVRIIVPDIKDCYIALGVVHSLWRHIPQEFDDYIASPKENGYRSLHTAVVGPQGKTLEIQIRTEEMHEDAELGVCAHWRYKGADADGEKSRYEQKISWLRQLLLVHEESGDLENIAEQLKVNDVPQERLYVFTPDGHVVDLQIGATPLDFAYYIHTEVGHSCRGAKVNGRIVPLNYKLTNGERVEILKTENGTPRRDWLTSSLGYVVTSRAKIGISNWFKAQDKEQNINYGRRLLEREFKRLALTNLAFSEVAKKMHFRTVEDMFASVGSGEMKAAFILRAAQELIYDEAEAEAGDNKISESDAHEDMQIIGVGNLSYELADCCNPSADASVVGYVTLGEKVAIHRQDCSTVLQLQAEEPERIIQVRWGTPERTYPVHITVQAYDRSGLLRDITAVFANRNIEVMAINMQVNKQEETNTIQLTVEIPSLAMLGHMLETISQLPNVLDVQRCEDVVDS